MNNHSFKELLIVAAKEIYDAHPTQTVKDTLNEFLFTIKILDALLIRDDIGLRSIEHYYINGKYVALNINQVLVLDHFYNEVTNLAAITTKYDTIRKYIEAQCGIK